MINTYNETKLHKTLKEIYLLENPGSTPETKTGDFIADILTEDGSVIEIQTGSLGHLYKKLDFFISEKRIVKVVYPLVTEKIIETSINPINYRRRKSPVKKNIYSIFRELTSIYPFLLSRYFTLEVLDVTITEERIEEDEAVQSKNGRRRFRKNWNKTGKRLEEIHSKTIFHGKKSWKLLMPLMQENFTVKELYETMKNQGTKITEDQARLMIWVFCRMGIIEQTGKKGKAYTYSQK